MALYEITSEPADLDFECTVISNIIDRTLRNVKNLISCRKGEVPFDRQRGLDPAIFDLPYFEANALIVRELDCGTEKRLSTASLRSESAKKINRRR